MGSNRLRWLAGAACAGFVFMSAGTQCADAADTADAAGAADVADASGTAAAPNATTSQSLDEVIVTARRRKESILNVPVVEDVVTSEVLERTQITDIADLATRVPGLNLGNAPLSIGPQVSLRGIGTNSLDAGIDQSVSLNIDGLSLTQGLAYSAGLFDLAQAEVLKGPQALFFGKNSPAGVVSLSSNDPGDHYEAIGRVAYETEAEQKRAEVILSGPVTDTLGMRLAGMASVENGFFHDEAQNLTPAAIGAATPERDFAHSESNIVRFTTVWKPLSNFTARLKANYAYDNTQGDAGQGQMSSCPTGTGPGPLGIQFLNPNDSCKLDRNIYLVDLNPRDFPNAPNSGKPYMTNRQEFGTLDLNYVTPWKVALTSITGYYNIDSDTLINAILTGFSAPPYGADNHFFRHDFSQELRAETDFSAPFNQLVGFYYQNGRISNHLGLPTNSLLFPPTLFPSGYLLAGSHVISVKSYSFFEQSRYKILPTLEAAVGVRWADETRSDRVMEGASPTALADVSLPNDGQFTSANFSPEFTLTWTPTTDFTLFGALKQGFKSGSFTITTPAATPHFGDERARGGEVGVKTRLFDRQLSLNAAFYDYDYKGLQVGASITDPVSHLAIIQTINAAGANTKGVDLDFNYRPLQVEGLRVSGATNYNHARFTQFPNAQCINGQTIGQGCDQVFNPGTGLFTGQDLTGVPLPHASTWQFNGAIDYDLPVSDTQSVRAGLGAQYITRYLRTLGTDPTYYQPGYVKIDANLAYGPKNGRWEVALVGRNLTDRIISSSCTASKFGNGTLGGQITGGVTNGPAGASELSCIAEPGRELWVRLSAKL
jgi:iron complex outermembrane recepter protein